MLASILFLIYPRLHSFLNKSPLTSQSPKTTPPKTEAKRPEEDESNGKSPQTTPSNVAVVSPMPSLKKQKLQKAAAAAMTPGDAEDKERLNNSNNKVNSAEKVAMSRVAILQIL